MGTLQKILTKTRNGPYSELGAGVIPTQEALVDAGLKELKKSANVLISGGGLNDNESNIELKMRDPENLSGMISDIARKIISLKETGIVSQREVSSLKNNLAKEIIGEEIVALYEGKIVSEYNSGNSCKKKFAAQTADAVVDAMFNVGKDKTQVLQH